MQPWRSFRANESLRRMLDRMAHRYACRPSDLLRSDPFALGVDVLAYISGQDETARRVEDVATAGGLLHMTVDLGAA